jgi:NitT/TauT family transport system ATP-binding protein
VSATIKVENLQKHYVTGSGVTRAVEDISFSVSKGEFVAIVGPSGAGKTTLLRTLAGLSPPTGGQILYKEKPVSAPPREFAVVFQDYARSLFPWFSVERNVVLPLVNLVPDAARRREIAAATLAKVGLSGQGGKRPAQLSGGQQQRVAIARALAYAPEVLIMDEPFASIDAQTRADLEDLVLSLRAETQATVIFVTHDVDEAVYMSDRVLVLSRSPSVILEDVRIDLPRPRDQIATKALPAFARARSRVLGLVRNAAPPPSTHID